MESNFFVFHVNFYCRSSDPYYSTYLYPNEHDNDEGIENSRTDYEYSDKFRSQSTVPQRTNSASSFQSDSFKMKEQSLISSSPNGEPIRKPTPVLVPKNKSKSQIIQGVPQTDV